MTTGTAAVVLTGALLSGCGSSAPAQPGGSASAAPAVVEPRGQLAARVAAAKDRRYGAAYSFAETGKATRMVLVTVATDGTWRVDVQGGALGGTRDVTIASRPEGQYQCPLNPSAGCVRVAAAGKRLPAAIDPRVQYPFSIWLDVLLDRQVPLSVAPAQPLPGSSGVCFNVEPAVTAMQPLIDPGVFCYTDDGMLTAAKLPYGTLALTGSPVPAPATVTLPGPVVGAAPLATTAPPPPPSPSATSQAPASPRPSRT